MQHEEELEMLMLLGVGIHGTRIKKLAQDQVKRRKFASGLYFETGRKSFDNDDDSN